MQLTSKQKKKLKKINNEIKKIEKSIKNFKGEKISEELPQLLNALSILAYYNHEKYRITGVFHNGALPAFIKKD